MTEIHPAFKELALHSDSNNNAVGVACISRGPDRANSAVHEATFFPAPHLRKSPHGHGLGVHINTIALARYRGGHTLAGLEMMAVAVSTIR